ETRCPGQPRGGSAASSPGAELQAFRGLVGVRPAGLGGEPPVPRAASARPRPVPEHGAPQPGEATGAEAAPPPSDQWQLTHAGHRPTPFRTQFLTLAYLLLQWNVPLPGGSCCWLHAALQALDRAREELRRQPCNAQHDAFLSAQCESCGLMMQGEMRCDFCNSGDDVASSSGIVDGRPVG
ncbi:unnamed protein product, partial [Prorocentrum cordatum]